MQVLRLLRRPRHAVSTITAAHSSSSSEVPPDSEGPFFDLDLASSDESDDACSSEDLDFIISLHRSRSASPSYRQWFCASEPSTKAGHGLMLLEHKPRQEASCRLTNLRALSFGVVGTRRNNKNMKMALYGGRPSFASSTRSSTTLRLFVEDDASWLEPTTANNNKRRGGARHSGDVIRRYLTSISRRLRRTVRPRPPSSDRRLRKSRSASAAVALVQDSRRRDDSLFEKQDGIASAIAHCKESFRRASLSECDSSLLRSRSDPGKC